MKHGLWMIAGCLVFLLIGCSTVQPKPRDLPFHSLYQVIDAPEVLSFLEDGIEVLERDYSPFEFPITQVYLRQSRKNVLGQPFDLAEGFSLTEIVDRANGICVIYIAVPPEDPEFYPLLAHEIGHLRQPSLKDDWDMEGFCMVFSERLCRELGKDWSVWTERFNDRQSADPYARAYYRYLEQ